MRYVCILFMIVSVVAAVAMLVLAGQAFEMAENAENEWVAGAVREYAVAAIQAGLICFVVTAVLLAAERLSVLVSLQRKRDRKQEG